MAAFWQPSLVTVWQAETGEWVGCRITCGSTGIHDAGRVLGFGGRGLSWVVNPNLLEVSKRVHLHTLQQATLYFGLDWVQA